MDFSAYGPSSQQWLSFQETHPLEAREGFADNTLSTATALCEKVNASRHELCKQYCNRTGISDKVDVSTIHIPTRDGETIPLRLTVPRGSKRRLRVMLYFHGGGMLFGSETSDDDTCADIAASLNLCVLNIVYRHTHQYPFPTQHNDAVDGFDYIRTHADELNIDLAAGISMGCISSGALPGTAVVLHDLARAKKERRRPYFCGVVLVTPWLVHTDNFPNHLFTSPEKSSRIQCRDAAVLPYERLKLFSDLIAAPRPDDPLLNPALVSDEALEGWPKTAFVVAGQDMLRDDALYFATRLEKLDVSTSVNIFPGQPHGFRQWQAMPAAVAFDDRTIDCIRWTLNMNGPRMRGWHEYQDDRSFKTVKAVTDDGSYDSPVEVPLKKPKLVMDGRLWCSNRA